MKAVAYGGSNDKESPMPTLNRTKQNAFMGRLLKRRVGEVKNHHGGDPLTFKRWLRMCCDKEAIKSCIVQWKARDGE